MPTATLTSAEPLTSDALLPTGLMPQLQSAIAEDLRPFVSDIDRKGHYPKPFMQRIGAIGGFGLGVPKEYGGAGFGAAGTIRVMEEVSKECLSTGFCVWCQTVCGWYIQNGESDYLKSEYLPQIGSGQKLAGTGMSNPMKHFADIEKIRVNAVRRAGGFVLNGALPWVSNAGQDHCFAAVAYLPDEGSYLMAIIPGDQPGLTHGDGGHFIALEGSSTHNAIFKDVFIPNDFVLAEPCKEYIARIRPGFVLTQTGFGLGLVESCIELMRRSNDRVGHVNCYLDDGPDEIEADLENTRRRVYALACEIGCGENELGPEATPEAVQCRIQTSELALRASQAAMLHAGAAGYRTGSAAERKLRESYFVAVVTPALKHLKKLQHDMQA
ncbi:MAG: acyl-CoA dehydrogenase family protein [Janthinobacterium lividum]